MNCGFLDVFHAIKIKNFIGEINVLINSYEHHDHNKHTNGVWYMVYMNYNSLAGMNENIVWIVYSQDAAELWALMGYNMHALQLERL